MVRLSKIKQDRLATSGYVEGDEIVKSTTEPDLFLYRKKGIHSVFHEGVGVKGGSTFKYNFTNTFETDLRARGLVKYWKVKHWQIKKIWKNGGEVSSTFGIGIHLMRELIDLNQPIDEAYELIIKSIRLAEKYIKENWEVGEVILENSKSAEVNYALPKHKDVLALLNKTDDEIKEYVDKMEEEFQELYKSLGYDKFDSHPEEYVTYIKLNMGGEIDKTIVTKKKTCRIADYKVQRGIEETKEEILNELAKKKASKLDIIVIQLSYYAYCKWKVGWEIEGGDVFSRDGEWKHHKLELIPMEEMEVLLEKYLIKK